MEEKIYAVNDYGHLQSDEVVARSDKLLTTKSGISGYRYRTKHRLSEHTFCYSPREAWELRIRQLEENISSLNDGLQKTRTQLGMAKSELAKLSTT